MEDKTYIIAIKTDNSTDFLPIKKQDILNKGNLLKYLKSNNLIDSTTIVWYQDNDTWTLVYHYQLEPYVHTHKRLHLSAPASTFLSIYPYGVIINNAMSKSHCYLGRSMGWIPIYLTLANKNSVGGFAFPDTHNLKITIEGKNIYYKALKAQTKVAINNHVMDWQTVQTYMDPTLREKLHYKLAPCSPEKFLQAYCELHEKTFNENFLETINYLQEIKNE